MNTLTHTEPGAVLDDEQIEAAHAATDIGADDGQPTRQAVPEGGALALLLVVAIAASTVGLHWLARVFG